MKILDRKEPGFKVLAFEKNCYLDNETEEYFVETVSSLIPKKGAILFDFQNLAYINSAGLSALIRVHNACREKNCTLRIFGTQERITSFFKITKLNALFEVYQSFDEASAGLN
jgi:anti-anti-sigma factor